MIDMSLDEAAIIIGNIPVPTDDDCYSISEYQRAKGMAMEALYYKKLCMSPVTNCEPAMPLEPIKPEGKWIEAGTVTYTVGNQEFAKSYSYMCNKCKELSLKRSKFCSECGQVMDTETTYHIEDFEE